MIPVDRNARPGDARGSLASIPWLAAAVAFVLLAGGGMAYRGLSQRYAQAFESRPIAPGALDRLPLEIGGWQGKDSPMTNAVIEATDTDAHLNREYTRTDGSRVALFIGYGGRFRDLMPHRPEVCYPGAGWTRTESPATLELQTSDGPLPCRVYRFSRGVLQTEAITVLGYYVLDGKHCADVSMLRKEAMRLDQTARYVAQVQIASADIPLQGDSTEAVRQFASESAGAILEVLERAVRDSASAQPGVHARVGS